MFSLYSWYEYLMNNFTVWHLKVKIVISRHWRTLTAYGDLRQSYRRRQSSCAGYSVKTDQTGVPDIEEEEDELWHFESFYFIAIHLSTVCINVILSPWCTCFSPLKFNPDLKKIYRNISNKWLNQEFYFAVVKLLLFMLRIFTTLIFMDNVQTSYKINKNNYFFARIKGFMKFLLCHLVLTTLIFSKFLLSTVLNLDYFDELDLCIYGTKTAVESEISSIFWITSLM